MLHLSFSKFLIFVTETNEDESHGLVTKEVPVESVEKSPDGTDSRQPQIPTESQITRANMAIHLDQFNPTINQQNQPGNFKFMVPSKHIKPSYGEVGSQFKLPKRKPNKLGSQIFHPMTKKKLDAEERPSFDDINVLHEVKRNKTIANRKTNETVVKSNIHTPLKSPLQNPRQKLKLGDLGNLGDTSYKLNLGDLGNLGATTLSAPAGKKKPPQEQASKRKFENSDSTKNKTNSKQDPETPSLSDLGEIATYKKEVAAAIRGLGPDANLVMKKSRVPTPRRRYWGVNTLGDVSLKDDIPGG